MEDSLTARMCGFFILLDNLDSNHKKQYENPLEIKERGKMLITIGFNLNDFCDLTQQSLRLIARIVVVELKTSV